MDVLFYVESLYPAELWQFKIALKIYVFDSNLQLIKKYYSL